jgi:hypothetical protein
MITDSYTSQYNAGGGGANSTTTASNKTPGQQSSNSTTKSTKFGGNGNSYVINQSLVVDMSYDNDFILDSTTLSNTNASSTTKAKPYNNDEEAILHILKSNSNPNQKINTLDDLNSQCESNLDTLLRLRNTKEFLDTLGGLITSNNQNEVKNSALKFLQTYFKAIEKQLVSSSSSAKRRIFSSDPKLNDALKKFDQQVGETLLPYLIESSVNQNNNSMNISVDIIRTYVKITDSVHTNCFSKFVKYGIENNLISASFIDLTLCEIIGEDLRGADFGQLVHALLKKLSTNVKLESSVMKCLNKIESVSESKETFTAYINKLSPSLQTIYKHSKQRDLNNSVLSVVSSNNHSSKKDLRFNFISNSILNDLSGENEIQRLQAIQKLEQSVRQLTDMKKVYPHYQDFIQMMNQFVDDSNYEVRVNSLKILCIFVQKMGTNVNQCYKAICACVRNIMSQTHQSKTIKQLLNTLVLTTVDLMINPMLVLESLLEKIKNRTAKAREEILNVIMASLLKYPNDKFDSALRKIFFQVVPLLCDIKRTVRHAALECTAVLYQRIKENVSEN